MTINIKELEEKQDLRMAKTFWKFIAIVSVAANFLFGWIVLFRHVR